MWQSLNTTLSNLCSSTFWDDAVTWNSPDPELTPCFKNTVLIWLPCAFLGIFSPLEFYHIHRANTGYIRFNWYNASKLVFIAILGTISLVDVISFIFNGTEFPVGISTPIIKFLTFCLFFGLTYAHTRCGIRSSGVLYIFSFFLVVCGAPQLRTELKLMAGSIDTNNRTTNSISYSSYYLCVLGIFILNCFADGEPVAKYQTNKKHKTYNPENEASFLSRIFFFWFGKFAWRGYKNTLTPDKLWNLDEDLQTEEIKRRFKSKWNLAYRSQKSRCAEDKKKESVLRPLIAVFGPAYAAALIFKSLHSVLLFACPVILKSILDFVSAEHEFPWHGYFYAVLLLVASIGQALSGVYQSYIFNKIGLQMTTALTSIIYEKTLRISSGARRKFTHGEIVNLMAVDAQRFATQILMSSLVVVCPLEIILAIYLLWELLGFCVLAGIAVLAVLTPFSSKVINKVRKFQLKQMKLKDLRIRVVNEILSGIKILKLYAFEENFERLVAKIREKEIGILKNVAYLYAGTSFAWLSSPFLVSFLTFGVYVLSSEKNVLNAKKAFVSMSLFNLIKSPMKMLPISITAIIQLNIAMKRIDEFLNSEELDQNAVTYEPMPDEPIKIENGVFSWENYNEPPILKNIHVKVRPGSLVAIVGSVGSGKSSLLSAILGEMYKQSGSVNTTGRIAYVPQQAWIRNTTFKDNVTFGGVTMKSSLYKTALEACALIPDLETLPGGDETEVGEKGINLSGGQKQRLNLARAVYSEADVYLLDDPLSAVDAHVGKHIFERVIGPNGLLKEKTRVWVTNNVNSLPFVDNIIVLENGMISESGTYNELLKNGGDFANFLNSYAKEVTDEDTNIDQSQNEKSLETPYEKKREEKKLENNGGHQLIIAEVAQTGNVTWSVCSYYLKASGSFMIGAMILTNLLQIVFSVASSYWLSAWSNDADTDRDNVVAKQYMYLGVYALFGVGEAISIMAQTVAVNVGALRAAKHAHNSLLSSVLHWPATTFDKIPSGRIMNRFGSDVDTLDNSLPGSVANFSAYVAVVVSILLVISYNTPAFLYVLLPVGAIYYLTQRINASVSKQLMRMVSVSRSPIYSHFGDTITGVQSIRAHRMETEFINALHEKVDINQLNAYARVIAQRWYTMLVFMLGYIIIFATAVFAVYSRQALTPALVGLSITYALQVTTSFMGLVREASEVETSIVAVERIKEYTEIEKEAPWVIPNRDRTLPENWPNVGHIVFRNYRMRYQNDLEPALKGISFEVVGGEKVGIVGRTGSGKSSLALSLFRLVESMEGNIFIDNVDISQIGLHTLRSHLTIIPQDPVLFSGTLRMNLDPAEKFTDEALWECLELVGLKEYMSTLNAGLQYEISESGSNFSVGQRQLVCLGRALLRKTKVLILDEATAAVDFETDALIQATIHEEFKGSTVLTIAHRLNTVLDYDRIMVLDDGNVAEFDAPRALLESKSSIFYRMACDAGLV